MNEMIGNLAMLHLANRASYLFNLYFKRSLSTVVIR